MLKHMVLMQLKEGISHAEVDALFSEVLQLKNQVPGVMSFSCGQNHAQNEDSKRFTHAFTMDFVDQEYLEHFRQHPSYHALQAKIKQSLQSQDAITEFDYEL